MSDLTDLKAVTEEELCIAAFTEFEADRSPFNIDKTMDWFLDLESKLNAKPFGWHGMVKEIVCSTEGREEFITIFTMFYGYLLKKESTKSKSL